MYTNSFYLVLSNPQQQDSSQAEESESSFVAVNKKAVRRCPYCNLEGRGDNILKHLKTQHKNVPMIERLDKWKMSKPKRHRSASEDKECSHCEGRFVRLDKHLLYCKGFKMGGGGGGGGAFYCVDTQTPIVVMANASTQWLPQPAGPDSAVSAAFLEQQEAELDQLFQEQKHLNQQIQQRKGGTDSGHSSLDNSRTSSTTSTSKRSFSSISTEEDNVSIFDICMDDGVTTTVTSTAHEMTLPLSPSTATAVPIRKNVERIIKTRRSSSTQIFIYQMQGLREFDYDLEGAHRKVDSERDRKNFKSFSSFLRGLIKVKLTKIKRGQPCDLRHIITCVDNVKQVTLDTNVYKINTVSTYISHIRHVIRYMLSSIRRCDEYSVFFQPLTVENIELADERYRAMKVTSKKEVRKYTAAQKPLIRGQLLRPEEILKIKKLYAEVRDNLLGGRCNDRGKKQQHQKSEGDNHHHHSSQRFMYLRNSLLLICMVEMPLRITPYINLLGSHLEEAVIHENEKSVFLSMKEVEHKCEVAGVLEIVLSIETYKLLTAFCQLYVITRTQHVFCSQRLRPLKSTSALSSAIFRKTKALLGRELGPLSLRKSATTAVRHLQPELARDAAELLQHSEQVAAQHYTAALSEDRKVHVGRAIRACLGLQF